jgi:hypothetical protein
MKSIKYILIALILVLLSPIVLAATEDFTALIRPLYAGSDEISIYDEAYFNLTLINNKPYEQHMTIYSPNIDQWVVFFESNNIDIPADGVAFTTVRIKPKKTIVEGNEYGIQLNVKSKNSSSLNKVYAYVNVKSQQEINQEYLPILVIDAQDIGKIDPTEPMVYSISIENKNIRDIKNLEVSLNSDIFNEEIKTDLGPLKKKTLQFTLKAPSDTASMKDNLIIALRLENKTIISDSVEYIIIGVEKYDYSVEYSKAFLLVDNYVTIVNEGNLETTAEYSVPTNLINYLFIHGKAESKLKYAEGKYTKVYYVPLKAGEKTTLIVTVSYRPILYALIGIVIIIIFYFLLRSPLVIKKSISSIVIKGEGISELKVILHIKNRTNKMFDDLIILDRIPRITEIGKGFEIGTVKPTKVMHHPAKGTIAKWEITSIDSFEERVIAYKLQTTMNVIGGFTLPLAILKYRAANGQEKAVSSNQIKVVLEKEMPEKA